MLPPGFCQRNAETAGRSLPPRTVGAAGAHRAGNSDQLLRVHDVGRDLEARREHGNELIGLSLILKIFPTLGRFADDELQIDVERG